MQRAAIRNSEIDVNSEGGLEQDSNFSELNEILNASSDDSDSSDSIDGFVNIRPGNALPNRSEDRYLKSTLQIIYRMYGNLTCLFISRSIKARSIIKLSDFLE